MKRAIFAVATLLTTILSFAPVASAQDHGQVGAFVDYLHVRATDSNFVGLGGRAAFNANRYVGFEAEMAYDFNRAFSETFAPTGTGSVTTVRSNLRILDGLFGPTFSTGHGPLRLFVTAKGGFIDFRFDPRPVTFGTFTSSVTSLRASNVDGVFYPGAGVEAFIGPVGLRLDVGDEIYFDSGAHNNLRVTFGPTIRF
jgi:Outer membrane protein beta-barrel domain